MNPELSAIVFRLQNMQPFNIHAVAPDGSAAPWYEVTGPDIIPQLILKNDNVLEQVQTVAGNIAHWGRLAAQSKRVWEIEEREYRIWRDTLSLALLSGAEKKMTQAAIEQTIRSDAKYREFYARIERAEEAHAATLAILDGWRAKKDMLKAAIIRTHEDSAAQLTI